MRDILTNLDLAELQAAKSGYILNLREDGVKMHRAGCEAVGAMVSTAYRKKYFEDRLEARRWADGQFGVQKWKDCGYCHGVGNPI